MSAACQIAAVEMVAILATTKVGGRDEDTMHALDRLAGAIASRLEAEPLLRDACQSWKTRDDAIRAAMARVDE